MRNNRIIFLLISVVFLTLGACKKDSDLEAEEEQVDNSQSTVDETLSSNTEDHEAAADYVWDSSSVIPVVLNGSSITVSSTGATASGSKLTITSAGNYSFSGSLTDGQIVVNTTDAATVRLILNGATIHSSSSAPIYIKNSTKTVIVLADNTANKLSDGTSYTYDVVADEEPNATIFSKSDLSFYGNGSLTIESNFNDAINTKDGLVIKSGTLNITSADDGIRGKDYVVIRDGNITINSKGDGIKSDNDEDTGKGYVLIKKGTYAFTTGSDGIQAETDVLISAGKFTLTTGGGSSQTIASTSSAKAIKGGSSVVIDDGTFVINSADDALHSNGSVAVNGGAFTISTGDDAVHADSALGISGGTILITKCYEGLESKVITINKGEIRLTASDDGINGSDGSGSTTGGMGGFPGQGGGNTSSGNAYLYMNGGYVFVNAGGDGVDVNGSIEMTGGTLIVNGPTDNGNGPLDYDGTFKITGGTVLAVGSSGMAQAPSTSSSQYSVLLNLSSAKTAGTLVHFQKSDGSELFTFAPAKKYQSIAYSSSSISSGTSIDVYFGGSSSGTVSDGLYSGGSYSGGTQYTTISVSGITTTTTR